MMIKQNDIKQKQNSSFPPYPKKESLVFVYILRFWKFI